MGRVTETISTVNSAIRTLLIVAILGLVGATGLIVYDRIQGADEDLEKAREDLVMYQGRLEEASTKIDALQADVQEKSRRISRLELAMNLLKTDQRLARLDVVDQTTDPETDQMTTTVRFTELTPDGDPIGEGREYTVQGDVVYLDNWVVKFDDKYVEQADLLRGTSLALFRRVFGEHQAPSEGFVIDEVGSMPQAYVRGGEPTPFAKEIWQDFWTFANDPEAAREKGIRAAHGEAVSMKVKPGHSYRVVLRASDGLSIVPVTEN